jgi:hypothetical protein
MAKEAGPRKRPFSKSESNEGNKRGGREGGKKGGDRKQQGGKPFKKRENKAIAKIRGGKENQEQGANDTKGGRFEVVKAEEPEKFKKFSYKGGSDGAQMNRRQKQKVSDLIKKLRVRAILRGL